LDAKVISSVKLPTSAAAEGSALRKTGNGAAPSAFYAAGLSQDPDSAGDGRSLAENPEHVWPNSRPDAFTPAGRLAAGRRFGTARKHVVMRMSDALRSTALCALVAAATLGPAGGALAFENDIFDDSGEVKAESNPWSVFQFGYSAYKNGHKDQAVEAYRYAAENGQLGATWKLARMYAEGDGVARDDYEAFKFFSEIARQDVEPGSPEESYMSDALVALGSYWKNGIPGSPVQANPAAAQEYYMRAAANYRNPNAQFEMGNMFLKGEGVKASVRQAGRWFQLAAEKGHAGAQATLGNLLFQSGKVVRGLAMMTAALERASPNDRPWIRGMQEEAFALAAEADRRTAIALADDILTKGHQ
jgi:TPR repeat protein